MACLAPNCDQNAGAPYKTEKVDAAIAWAMMQAHIALAHPVLAPAGPAREVRPQAERVKRPAFTLSNQSIYQEDYYHFKYQYSQYKARLRDNADNPSRLLECLAEDVSKMLFSSLGAEMTNLTEAQLFDSISASCVTKQTVQARMAELHRIKQDPGQPYRTSKPTCSQRPGSGK